MVHLCEINLYWFYSYGYSYENDLFLLVWKVKYLHTKVNLMNSHKKIHNTNFKTFKTHRYSLHSWTPPQMRVFVAIMQVGFSAVHYVHDCLYCNYTGDSFFYSYVGDSFFSSWQPVFIKLTRKHLKPLYKVCISPLL